MNETEATRPRDDLAFARTQQRRWLRFSGAAIAIVLAVGTPLAIQQAQHDRALGYLAFGTLAVYVLIIVWAYLSNSRDIRRRIEDNFHALHQKQGTRAHV